MEDRGEQHPWLESIKNLYAIAIEWMDKALDKINSRDDPREFLDIDDGETGGYDPPPRQQRQI